MINYAIFSTTYRWVKRVKRIDDIIYQVLVYKKVCSKSQTCTIRKISSALEEEVKFAILKKATLLYDTDLDAGVTEYRKKVGDRNKRVSERKAPKD